MKTIQLDLLFTILAAFVVLFAGRTLVARIDVRYEDHASDEWLAVLQRHAQIVDGHKGGRLNTTLFPDGLNDITRRQGASQVKRMPSSSDTRGA